MSWIYLVWGLIDFWCLCLLSNLEDFSHCFFGWFLYCPPLLYFFQDFLADMNTIIPQVLTAHSLICILLFLCCSDWVISSVLSFMSLILSSVTSIFLCWAHHELPLVTVFMVLKFPFDITPSLCWNFLFFTYLKCVHNFTLKHFFMIVALQFSSDDSVISVSVIIYWLSFFHLVWAFLGSGMTSNFL